MKYSENRCVLWCAWLSSLKGLNREQTQWCVAGLGVDLLPMGGFDGAGALGAFMWAQDSSNPPRLLSQLLLLTFSLPFLVQISAYPVPNLLT